MPRDLKSFKDLINDGIIKTTGTLFTHHSGILYYAKFESHNKIYPAVYKDGKLEYDKEIKFTSISKFAKAMILKSNPQRKEAGGMDTCYYSDNEEYYDSIKLKEIRDAAYEEVVMESSL